MKIRTNERRLAASAAIVSPSNEADLRRLDEAKQKWTKPAWKNYDTLGEIHYPANFIGGSLSRFEFHVKRKVFEEGQINLVDLADNDCNRAMDALENGDGISELARLFAINWTVGADCYLVGKGESDTEWKLYSSDSVEFQPENLDPGKRIIVEGQPLGAGYARRIWRSHPNRRDEADGAMQSLETPCKQLKDLNDSISAQIQSRLASAGILFIPNSLQLGGAVSRPAGTGLTVTDPLVGYLMDVFEAGIQDRSSASGRLPIVLRGPDSAGQHIRHIVLDRLLNEQEMQLRNELRHTIFTSLDLPPEVISGLGDLSHWTTWSVMDSSYRIHILPIGQAWADALTKIYLRPFLLAAKREPDEIRDFVIVADGANAVARPNEAEDTRQLRDRGALSLKALRRRNNIEESEKPDDDEYIRWIGEKFQDPYLATWGLSAKIDLTKTIAAKPVPGPAGDPGKTERPKVDNSNTTAGRPGGGAGGNAGGVKGKSRTSDAGPEALLVAYRAGFTTIGARLRAKFSQPGHSARRAEIKSVTNPKVHIQLRGVESDIAGQSVSGVFDDLLDGICDSGQIAALEVLAARDVQVGRAPSLTFETAAAIIGADTKEFANV